MALASGYWTNFDVTADYSIGAATTHEILLRTHHARLRQNGHVIGANFFFGSVTGLTSVIVKIWRRRASGTFDLVGSSNNIVSFITPSTVNNIIFSTAIQNCREGDYVAMQILGSGNGINQLAIEASDNSEVLSVNSVPATTNFAWLSQTATSGLIKIQAVVSSKTDVVWIGYSVMAGHNTHMDYCEETTVAVDGTADAPTSTIPHFFNQIAARAYQNVGKGGETAAAMLARFMRDVVAVSPEIVVIQAGGNEVLAGSSVATLTNAVSSMLDLCVTHGIEVVLTSVPPGTAFTQAQCLLRDQYNVALQALALSHAAQPMYVDLDPVVGKFRAGGPVGNYWDMQTDFGHGDGLHYMPVANRLMGHRIARAVGRAVRSPATARVTLDE